MLFNKTSLRVISISYSEKTNYHSGTVMQLFIRYFLPYFGDCFKSFAQTIFRNPLLLQSTVTALKRNALNQTVPRRTGCSVVYFRLEVGTTFKCALVLLRFVAPDILLYIVQVGKLKLKAWFHERLSVVLYCINCQLRVRERRSWNFTKQVMIRTIKNDILD